MRQHAAHHLLCALRTQRADELLHQQQAQPFALQVRPHHHAKLGVDVVRVGHGTHRAQCFFGTVGPGGHGHDGGLALVVDLHQPRQLTARNAAAAAEDAHADVVRGQPAQKRQVLGFVFGPYRAQSQAPALPLHMLSQVRRIRPDGKVVRTGGGCGADADARIQCHRALGVEQQRVDVQLGDFRHIGQQLRHRHQHRMQSRLVSGGRVAKARQQPGHPGALHQGPRQIGVERRQRHRPVGHHLNRCAALAKQDHRAKNAVDAGADDQLMRMAALHHGLHREAVDARRRVGLADARQHGQRSVLHLGGAGQVEHHAAAVGFVRDVGRQDLQHHRKADRLRRAGSLRRQHTHASGGHHRDAASRQHRLGLGLGEHVAAFGQHLLHQSPHRRQAALIVGGRSRQHGRRLHQLRLVAPVGHPHRKRAHRFFGG